MHAGRDRYDGTSWAAQNVRAQSRALRIWVSITAAILGGLPLHGCIEAPPDGKLASELAPDVNMAPETPQAPAPVSLPAPKPAPKRPGHGRTARNTEQAAKNIERKVTTLDPVALMGMAPPAIGNILGKPAGTREAALTTEWTYATRSCSLVIVFYPDITTGALHALKFNVTDGEEDGASCIHHILLARSDDHG